MVDRVLQPLPLGSSEFSTLRQCGEIYVDKTDLINEICRNRGKFFLTRPRRFGKSLLVSTMASLFRHGLRDFEGLAIESLWEDKTYDVVRLDFSEIADFDSVEEFRHLLSRYVASKFEAVGFSGQLDSWFIGLSNWLDDVPGNSLVLLIDEYDAPLVARLEDAKAFDEIQKTLRSFFSKIKSHEGCLRFFFMTGITKLSNTGIFSVFNNFTDISWSGRFSTLLGYTEEEIKNSFGEHLQQACSVLDMSQAKLLAELRAHYNGFCFDENARTRVFNPWSVLSFFSDPQRGFKNYWYQTGGQPSVLRHYLALHNLESPAHYDEPRGAPMADLRSTVEYASITLDALLVQTGYLTVKRVLMPDYVEIGYPNEEVARSFAQLYAEALLSKTTPIAVGLPRLNRALSLGNFDEVIDIFNRTFTAIDYERYPIRDEFACRAFLQVLLIGAVMMPQVEVHNAHGRSDLEVTGGDLHWVFEIKFARSVDEVEKLATAAEEQIKNRRYGEVPDEKRLVRAVLVFSEPERRFASARLIG